MKKYFYELDYRYVDRNGDNHYFSIGYFSSLTNAKLAVEKAQNKPGFKDFNGSFEIAKFGVNFSENIVQKSGLILYELSHEYLDSDGYDNFIIFGVYATYEEAKAIQLKKLNEYPYTKFPDGFLIAECKVDSCGWSEGFSVY